MNKKIKYLLMIIIVLLISIIIPLIVNGIIINNNFYSNASNDGWVSFFGSYFGGILGGFGTLIGVLITLRETRKENIKPFLVLDFDENPKEIYSPEKYSKVNKRGNIMNFYQVPLISEIFDINIRNTGKGYAKNIQITLLVKIEDSLIADKNLFWLSQNPLQMERVSVSGDNYFQKHEITYIGSEGDKKLLPINSSLNGIILCSLWNIDDFLNLKAEDFQQTIQYYHAKKKKTPLTIPDVSVYLQYYDLDNNKYEAMYKIGLDFILNVLGSHNLVKARLYFEDELSFIKKDVQKLARKNKERKPKKISRKMKQTASLKKEWSNTIYKFGLSIGLSDNTSKAMSKDSAFERYFFLCYENERASLEQLIINIAVCCYDEINMHKFINKKMISLYEELRQELLNIISLKNKRKYSRIINRDQTNYNKINDLSRLKRILNSKTEIFGNYFKSYEVNNGKDKELIHIYGDSRDGINIMINIGNDQLKTELGFYRTGFTYRRIDNSENNLIVSVIKNIYINREIGFLDERGPYFEKDQQWKCIYLR
ncbi:hypothetical protein J2TS6_24830 [Paenibacillus albilobatus]|uniref:Uncharacterized protein n=1 Tax=Paenibacillus albilobatus TaxID=2716884 RepID=A0A919XIG9_9BACL|nr:hypothetical protein [Paenibacillus albilobatus]GIO31342.1 hypothetical protein J2TS6_24830 [Paenibacillus albilobatus]